MILPQNFSEEAGSEVYGIPDRTIGRLLDDLAFRQGDNIVRPKFPFLANPYFDEATDRHI